ncbi:MAG: SIS domain-containing protein [Chloroflexi bacterium]|nr:MAG: SIS domain-containing protein [Chloroflexota bacterium]
MRQAIIQYLEDVRTMLAQMPLESIEQVLQALLDVYEREGTVFIMGNGGSAATASHFAGDLAKGTAHPGLRRFRVVPLTDNVPLITAWANDVDYEWIFAEQLRNLVRPGDLVIGISGSGNSPNVLNAIALAREMGATTVGLTGGDGGKLALMADIAVIAPSDTMEQIEDAHLVLEHLICTTLRDEIRRREIASIEALLGGRPKVPAATPTVLEEPLNGNG